MPPFLFGLSTADCLYGKAAQGLRAKGDNRNMENEILILRNLENEILGIFDQAIGHLAVAAQELRQLGWLHPGKAEQLAAIGGAVDMLANVIAHVTAEREINGGVIRALQRAASNLEEQTSGLPKVAKKPITLATKSLMGL